MKPDIVVLIALLLLLAMVVLSDVLKRKIYNANLAVLVFVSTYYRHQLPDAMWSDATLYALLALLIGMLLWQRRLLGAGDVKLAVICVWMVFPNWGELILLSALGAGVLAIWQLARQRLAMSNNHQGTIPLGVSISASTVYLLF
ncbi:prepilin peptidase [Vibrio vulnificus]|uniref:prepilin peptidase n=1 Tax=Vibrio vulnificus TaxID=672 RepID=UPI003D9CB9F0